LLKRYHEKRNFSSTTEPESVVKTGKIPGKAKPKNMRAGKTKLKFVIHQHFASHLHYDLRLELEGVLKSWAVPKGIPESTEEKRLAVETEDHPLGYADFEGAIPKGQYGAGTVKIWDKGVYELKVWDENMVEFTLKGQRLRGRYVLVRLKKAGEKNWLLLRGREKDA